MYELLKFQRHYSIYSIIFAHFFLFARRIHQREFRKTQDKTSWHTGSCDRDDYNKTHVNSKVSKGYMHEAWYAVLQIVCSILVDLSRDFLRMWTECQMEPHPWQLITGITKTVKAVRKWKIIMGCMQHWLNRGDVINLWECTMGVCNTG